MEDTKEEQTLDSDSEYSLTGINDSDSELDEDKGMELKTKMLDKLKSDPLFIALQEKSDSELDTEQKEQLDILREQIKLSDQDRQENQKLIMRNINDLITIHDGWNWKFNPDQYKYTYTNMTFDDIGQLCGSRLNFIRNKFTITDFFDIHCGIQKFIILEQNKINKINNIINTKIIIIGEEAGQIYFEVDDKPIHLLDNDELNNVIKHLKKCETDKEFDDYIQYIFEKDYVRQCLLVLIYAYNVSISKRTKKLIKYINHDSGQISDYIDEHNSYQLSEQLN